MFETQKSGNKTSAGEIGFDIRTHASPKVWTILPNLTFYLVMWGFHRTFATGSACQQRTLTPPDTWSHFGTCMCSNVGTNLSCIVLFPAFWVSNIPRYFCFSKVRRMRDINVENLLIVTNNAVLLHKSNLIFFIIVIDPSFQRFFFQLTHDFMLCISTGAVSCHIWDLCVSYLIRTVWSRKNEVGGFAW